MKVENWQNIKKDKMRISLIPTGYIIRNCRKHFLVYGWNLHSSCVPTNFL